MFKAFLRSAQATGYSSYFSGLILRVSCKSLSTNTAIARGVRKSKFPPDERGSRFSPDGRRPTRLGHESSRRTFDQHDRPKERDTTKIRRPNHQQRQDIEDMEESARLRVGRLTPKQQNYLRGGRKPSNDTSQRESSNRSFRQPYSGGQSFSDRPERPGRYSKTEPTAKPLLALYDSDKRNSTGRSPSFQRGDRFDSETGVSQGRAGQYRNTRPSFHTAYGSSRPENIEHSSKPQRANQFDREASAPRSRVGRYSDTKPAVHSAYDPGTLHDADLPSSYGNKDFYTSESDHPDPRRKVDYDFSDSDEQAAALEQTSGGLVYGNKAPFGTSDRSYFSEEGPRREIKTPLSIPYTTPASEFLYGSSVVIAALKTARRKLYKLYLYDGEHRDVANQDKMVMQLARSREVEVVKVQKDWLRLMDKMSGGRPHNGYVLEASPLPKLPVTGLHPVKGHQEAFNVALDHQSKEDVMVNGKNPNIIYKSDFPRYPIVLMLDGILDPGNLGGILRSAYFLGIDAVAISNKHSAPLTPVTLKASAGASESLPLVSISHPAAFIEQSQSNGWKFYAAVTDGTDTKENQVRLATSSLDSPARNHPCVLLLGGEGEGLRWNLQKKADYLLSIEGYRSGQGGVDSLNVSVAAGLLCEVFLRKPSRPLKAKRDLSVSDPTKDIPSEKATISEEALF